MVGNRVSGCINHPGVESVARCKQCGKAVCKACLVTGPTGNFCSDTCRDKHQEFIRRAQELERKKPAAGNGLRKLVRFAIKLAFFAAILIAVGVAGIMFDIPVLSDVVRVVIPKIAPYVPFL
ncbi:MAG: hypothetical protein GWP08_09030 [Nitrospiraceae bacterium]|nr:hypothetical protein [Nitrospiraceae bacterium]